MKRKSRIWAGFTLLSIAGCAGALVGGVLWLALVNLAFAVFNGVSWAQNEREIKRWREAAAEWKRQQTVGGRAVQAFLSAAPENYTAVVDFLVKAENTPAEEWFRPPKLASPTEGYANVTATAQVMHEWRKGSRDAAAARWNEPIYGERGQLVAGGEWVVRNSARLNVKEEHCKLYGGHVYLLGRADCYNCGRVKTWED